MIDFLQGPVAELSKQRIIVMAGDVGYGIQVPDEHVFARNEIVKLYIHTNWNQDKGPSLFGFQNILDKQLFQIIVGCAGIGPKIGLAVLAHMSAGSFISVITQGDVETLSDVNGIGHKKAENMIVQLRNKVAKLVDSGVELGSGGKQAKSMSEISQVLGSLSYSKSEIASALEYVKKSKKTAELTFDGLLRKALGYLSKQT